MSNTYTPSNKIVKVKITDNSGHTTLEEIMEKAAQTVIREHYENGKWPWVGAKPFTFTATSLDDHAALGADIIRLYKELEEQETPLVVMTGALVGGSR